MDTAGIVITWLCLNWIHWQIWKGLTMARHCTGRRNKHRTGRSTYSTKHKSRTADRYARWSNGHKETSDVIAGNVLAYRPTGALASWQEP